MIDPFLRAGSSRLKRTLSVVPVLGRSGGSLEPPGQWGVGVAGLAAPFLPVFSALAVVAALLWIEVEAGLGSLEWSAPSRSVLVGWVPELSLCLVWLIG